MSTPDHSIFGYYAEQAGKLSDAVEQANAVIAEEAALQGDVRVRAKATGEVIDVILGANAMKLSPAQLGAIITKTANVAREKSAAGAQELISKYVALEHRAAHSLDMESPEAGAAFRKLQASTRPTPNRTQQMDDDEFEDRRTRRGWKQAP